MIEMEDEAGDLSMFKPQIAHLQDEACDRDIHQLFSWSAQSAPRGKALLLPQFSPSQEGGGPPQVLSLLEGETPHPVLTQWPPAWGPRACKKCSPGAAESGSV